MNFKEWLQYAVKNRSNGVLPKLKLVDGTELSVNASERHMCFPKKKLENGDYVKVEVCTHGREVEGLKDLYDIIPFTYGYVGVDYMEDVCKMHGGICE